MSDEKIKVLFDTDIGSDIDDAVALAYLLSEPRCELVGITAVSGQVCLRAEMASAMCINVGRDDIPVYAGAEKPLLIPNAQPAAPQAAALGARPRRKDFQPGAAIEFMRRTIRENPGQITLLAVGPLTNLALLFAADPELPSLLKQVVLMGGRFFAAGGEWNIYVDPHAASIVYGGGAQSRPPRHVSYGLDVTLRCSMPAEQCRQRFTAKVLQPVRDFAEVWFTHRPQIVFHDPLAAVSLFEPDLCQYKQGLVEVSTTPPTSGVTVFSEPKDENTRPHTVAGDVAAERFFNRYFGTVK